MEDESKSMKDASEKVFEKLLKGEIDGAKILKIIETELDEKIVESYTKVLKKTLEEFQNKIKELDYWEIIALVLWSIYFQWLDSTMTNYKMIALHEGPMGSQKYKESLSKQIEENMEKDMRQLMNIFLIRVPRE